MKKILLVLSFTPKTDFWLADEFREKGYETTVISNPYAFKFVEKRGRLDKLKAQLASWLLGWKAHRMLRKGQFERVVFWNWNSAFSFVFRDWLSLFTRKSKIPVVALHLILVNPKGVKRKLWKSLFAFASKYSALYWGVNSDYEQEMYAKELGVDKQFFAVIPDSYEIRDIPSADTLKSIQVKPKNIFTGGANRDWKTLFQVAKLLPDYVFNCIALKRNFYVDEADIPGNVKIWFDTPANFFYTKLYESEIVCLPLNRMEACGLIVLTKAALMGKPLITTDTPNMRNYIVNGENGFLLPIGDAEGIVRSVHSLEEPEMRSSVVANMRIRIEEHSPQAYAERILSLV